MTVYRFATSLAVPCAAALAAACASASKPHIYVAPTQETVFTTSEEMTGAPGHIIYVENRSSVPITVYSVTLRDCENVATGCNGPRSLNLHLSGDSRAILTRVAPADPQKAFNFRYSMGWRADSSTTAALGALAVGGDGYAQQQLDAMARETVRQRGAVGAVDLDLTASEVAGLSDRAASLRALPDSIVLSVGGRATLDTVRVLLIGTQGETLGRIRALQWRVSGSSAITLVQPDTVVAVAPGRAAIQLRLPDDVLAAKPSLHGALEVPIVVRR